MAKNNNELEPSLRLEIISLLRIYCTIMNTFVTDKEAKSILQLLSLVKLDSEFVFFCFPFLVLSNIIFGVFFENISCDTQIDHKNVVFFAPNK